jgi:predicted metal-dependent phosphoesterase TrpH
VCSWAHPFRPHLDRWLPTFAAGGLHGVEALRPTASGADRRAARKMARSFGLCVTGGSDWHGWHEPKLGLYAVHRSELTAFLQALDAVA